MLEFYEFNTLNISILLIVCFIIYMCMIEFFCDKEEEKKNINIEKLIISFIISFIVSLIFAYFYTEQDEFLLNDNYKDNLHKY